MDEVVVVLRFSCLFVFPEEDAAAFDSPDVVETVELLVELVLAAVGAVERAPRMVSCGGSRRSTFCQSSRGS